MKIRERNCVGCQKNYTEGVERKGWHAHDITSKSTMLSAYRLCNIDKAPTVFPATPLDDKKSCIGTNQNQHSGYGHANPKGRVNKRIAVLGVAEVRSDSRGRRKSPYSGQGSEGRHTARNNARVENKKLSNVAEQYSSDTVTQGRPETQAGLVWKLLVLCSILGAGD